MNIGILGAGAMAQALGRHFLRRGHKLLLSYARDKAKLEQAARTLGGGTRVGSPREAAEFAECLILATGWDGAEGALAAAGPLAGKLVWSIVNPLQPDLSGLAVGTTTSGSEELARNAPGARFVAAWPPFATVLDSASTRFGSERQTVFMCGDDADAKRVIAGLLDALDVESVDAGALLAARFIEPAMLLLVHLAYRQKLGSVALRLLQHPTTK